MLPQMEMQVIGHVKTGYADKFGVPRQPGLVESARGRVIFTEAFRGENFLRGIEGFSHVWLLFQFHKAHPVRGRSTVRPPRLGGNERLGVFATRSSHRPNGIGMSVVELMRVDYESPEGPLLEVAGVDLVDGTPLLDVKPYISFCDSVDDAKNGYVSGKPEKLEVVWECEVQMNSEHRHFIEDTLAYDPRPAYQVDPERVYGCELEGWDVKWCVEGDVVQVLSSERA